MARAPSKTQIGRNSHSRRKCFITARERPAGQRTQHRHRARQYNRRHLTLSRVISSNSRTVYINNIEFLCAAPTTPRRHPAGLNTGRVYGAVPTGICLMCRRTRVFSGLPSSVVLYRCPVNNVLDSPADTALHAGGRVVFCRNEKRRRRRPSADYRVVVTCHRCSVTPSRIRCCARI